MIKKIAFIGAGSFIFTRNLVRDLLTYEAFRDATLMLMDIDDRKLDFSKKAVERIVAAGKYPAKVVATKSRQEALDGANGVVITILQGGPEVIAGDIEIPMRYGVDINVGDTRGPSGIFRALRTTPVMLDICADIARLAPAAIVLNYTNPMAMLCRAVQGTFPQLAITGLCHSVQGTAQMLAKWIGAPMGEITYRCAGINHQAWYLDYRWKGEDAYPLIRRAIEERPEIANEEQVRNEMFRHLDYYVTESSGHNSEYCSWFRKRPDLIEKYCTHGTGWNPGVHGLGLKSRRQRASEWEAILKEELEKPVELARGHEYAAPIFNACFGDQTLFEFNGNVRNTGLIENLPSGACVEVPVLASPKGFSPMHVGALPAHLAILNNISARGEELAVEAALEGEPRKVFHASLFDPLTSAVLSMQEIKDMVNELLAQNAPFLPQFKNHLKV